VNVTSSLIIHIQFQNISNQRKSEVYSHVLYDKAQQKPKYNLCSTIQKEVLQAPKVWSTIWHQSAVYM